MRKYAELSYKKLWACNRKCQLNPGFWIKMKTILTLSLALVVLSHAYPPSSSFMLPGVIIFDKFFSWKQSWFENSIEPLLFHEFTFKNESEDFFSRDLTQDWPTIRIWITWTTNRLLPMLRISVFWEEEEWIRRTAAVYINAWLLMRQYLVFCNVII